MVVILIPTMKTTMAIIKDGQFQQQRWPLLASTLPSLRSTRGRWYQQRRKRMCVCVCVCVFVCAFEREKDCCSPPFFCFVHMCAYTHISIVLRQLHLKTKGKLNEEYQYLLEKLGVVWDALSQQREDRFSLLQQYKERESNCNVLI